MVAPFIDRYGGYFLFSHTTNLVVSEWAAPKNIINTF